MKNIQDRRAVHAAVDHALSSATAGALFRCLVCTHLHGTV